MLFLVLTIVLTAQIYSQNTPENVPPSQNTWQLFTYDFANIFKGVGHSYGRPLQWKGQQWATLGAIVGGTGLLYIFDEETSDFSRNQRDGIPKFIKGYGTNFGSPQYNYMFTGGVYLTGLFTKNEKLRRTGVLLVSSATSAGLLQQLTKSVIGRARPVSGKSKDTFDPFNPNRDFHSFPSGHTMLAFSNAYVIAKHFKNPWAKAGIYTVGLIPGISRLWDGEHWFTDFALGVVTSIFIVESIDRYLDGKYKQKYNQDGKKVSWNLNFAPGRIGITGRF